MCGFLYGHLNMNLYEKHVGLTDLPTANAKSRNLLKSNTFRDDTFVCDIVLNPCEEGSPTLLYSSLN